MTPTGEDAPMLPQEATGTATVSESRRLMAERVTLAIENLIMSLICYQVSQNKPMADAVEMARENLIQLIEDNSSQ